VPVLRALLVALQGGSVTLRRCDVAAAGEAGDAAGEADVLLHAGGVLQVIFQSSTCAQHPQVPLPCCGKVHGDLGCAHEYIHVRQGQGHEHGHGPEQMGQGKSYRRQHKPLPDRIYVQSKHASM
jgi:hypothetical protein